MASADTIDRLFDCNRVSGQVWNYCVELARAHHVKSGKWITKSELQTATKGLFPIHSQSIQAVCHNYLFSRDAAMKARRKGLKNKYPYKKKKTFNTKWANNGFVLHENGKIELKMGNWKGQRQKPLVIWVGRLPQGEVKEIELIFDRKLMICMSYEDGVGRKENKGQHLAAIDAGEIHTIAAVASNGESVIITGRKMRSIHQLRNKKLAELGRKMSKCQKYSKQWKKYNRAKQYILSKSANQLKDALHKTTKQFVAWCLENKVREVAFGDVEGVGRNTSKRKKKNKKVRRQTTNQKVSNWMFGKLYQYLGYKLDAEGIELNKHDESFTSQQCPCCERRKKVASRHYRCKCGYEQHRDIHGASNFYAKTYYGEIRSLDFELKKTKYLRIA
ncbi:transposase [Bacillus horti]|uniref:RNA-guided endonuclease InsQ/TnpB family protein n=1 Tax=Caldalkalibacillus horti TaxID=77523 RepID=UPI0031D2A9C0